MSMPNAPLSVPAATPAGQAPGTLLAGLDMRIAETGPATQARRCSTDNGCDTQANGDC
ncbi:hypothetical protein [Nonomuraea sp. SYSU D8015]|uniref:hypothetical protein n=1 Tax=Nonomuraea sp. SYSU D8015 TaxID=2593644 RepID=UPI0016604F1B|nr:hypothetical protein [Nonomuraea sp. SYSU D8015]